MSRLCYNNLTMKWAKRLPGFTIVELAIVIVVIAILATIIIVAYNGVQNSARESAAAASLKQAEDKIGLYQLDNGGELPTTLAAASITNGGGKSWGYRLYDNDEEYCLSVTESGRSYFTNSLGSGAIGEGNCASVQSIAGVQHIAFSQTPGQSVSFPAITGTPDLTMYVVFDVIDTSGSYNTIAAISPAGNANRMQMDTAASGSVSLRYRIDTSATINMSASQSARTPGRHVGWLKVSDGMTVREFAYDQAEAHASYAMDPGTGWTVSGFVLNSASSSTAPIAGILYNDAHDELTRQRVLDWLLDTY